MSKAEDLSKQYRDYREKCGIKDPIMLDEIEEACFEGYHQAEKDLELSWEDMQNIRNIIAEMMVESYTESNSWPTHEEFSKEVLKRFKDYKK